MSEKVVCSHGHKFPVNLKKHTNRSYVFCPRCRDKVTVRKKHIFSPNPDWEKEKETRRQIRLGIREMGKKPMKVRAPSEVYQRLRYSTPLLMIMAAVRKRHEMELEEQKKEA